MRGIPEWFEQVARGLGDGTDWLVREVQTLPLLVRISGWLIFQAILFKAQPWLWRGLVAASDTVGTFGTLELQTKLLLVVVALLPIQTVVLSYNFKSQELVVNIVKRPDASTSKDAVADGGESSEDTRKRGSTSTSGFGAVLGLLSGAALGSLFGPAGTIGVAVLGAMLGDEYERRKKRDSRVVVRELEL